jgi:hypothetical protein
LGYLIEKKSSRKKFIRSRGILWYFHAYNISKELHDNLFYINMHGLIIISSG